jgi:hypothetical protein
MRRLVRSAGLATTALMNSSVCRLPFISISTCPWLASSTARAAAAWLGNVLDGECGDIQLLLPRQGQQLGPGRHQYRQDDAGGLGVQYRRQAGGIAGVDDGDLDRPQLARMVEQLLQLAIAHLHADFRQGGPASHDGFGGCDDVGLAFDHDDVVLIDAGAFERQPVPGLVTCDHGDAGLQRIADAYRMQEPQVWPR